MEGGEVPISATGAGLGRGPVDADGMARPPPTSPMRWRGRGRTPVGGATRRRGAERGGSSWAAACDLLGRKGGGCSESEEMATVGRSP